MLPPRSCVVSLTDLCQHGASRSVLDPGPSGLPDQVKPINKGVIKFATIAVDQYLSNIKTLLHRTLCGAIFNDHISINYNIYQSHYEFQEMIVAV